ARAAERDHREVTDVQAPLDRDLTQRIGLVPGGYFEDPRGTILYAEVELARQGRDPASRRVHIERDLAAQQMRRDTAEYQVRVGARGLGAALAVAQGARVRPGRGRPDLQGSLGREPADRTTARADGHDIDHRDLGRKRPDAALRGQAGFAVLDDRHVGGGAAA